MLQIIDKVMLKLQFLSTSMQSVASSLQISSNDGSSVGRNFITAIKSVGTIMGLILAVGVLVLIGLGVIATKREEKRAELMKWFGFVIVGLLLIEFAVGIVGYIVNVM
ncbi:hypothetical protein [Clostridium thermobutyricum]|uniref:hypothetical protein n=1 Tax=Clostridium thermobutyricum TaxID=29372 RepID=UPI0018AA3298|nr:hypothetical protein [Clostridium thermobutyricum]